MRASRLSHAAAIARLGVLPILMLAMIVVHAPAVRAADADSDTHSSEAASKQASAADDRQESRHDNDAAHFMPGQQRSTGSVTVGGQRIDYVAYSGTLVVHPKGWDDVPQNTPKNAEQNQPEASMFYVAYFKVPAGQAADASSRPAVADKTRADKKASKSSSASAPDLTAVGSSSRPVTFLYNGGPGSSTVWLHMGAFGPRRVVATLDSPMRAAPYQLVNNNYSLLDASDLVFVDAPGTGFSRIAGKDRDKAFYGVDQDAWAFSDFIVQFLSKYGRWNSPKYLFGESYGTTRSAVLANLLESDRLVDLNGVILLSQILNYDDSPDGPQLNPGISLPYELALPTYAATAWFHHKLPGPQRELAPLLQEVEHYAMNDYARALEAGTTLTQEQIASVAEQLHAYTGLPVDYIIKANLRINGGEFEQNVEGGDTTSGRLDTRFVGPSFDPLSEEAEYDPQSAAISSAYVSTFNDYVRRQLHYGQDQLYKPEIDTFRHWDFKHAPPGVHIPLQQATNVMPDLEIAMKYDPQLRVMLNAGYFDLATPFYQGIYEMQHLQLPPALRDHIQFAFYESGHMVYVKEEALQQLHANVARFIAQTDNVSRTAPGAAATTQSAR